MSDTDINDHKGFAFDSKKSLPETLTQDCRSHISATAVAVAPVRFFNRASDQRWFGLLVQPSAVTR